MDVLYLSSMISCSMQQKLFETNGTISSYASQRFNRLLVSGLMEHGCNIDALSHEVDLAQFLQGNQIVFEEESGIKYEYICAKNRGSVIFDALKRILAWKKHHRDGIVICDIIFGELSIAANIASLFFGVKTVAIVTDVPLARALDNRKGLKKIPVIIKQVTISFYSGYIFLTQQMNSLLNKKNRPYVVVEGIAQVTPTTSVEKNSPKTCMMAGLLEDEFGVSLLIDAFKKVRYENAELVFYGKGFAVDAIIAAGKGDKRIKYGGQLTNQAVIEEEKKATLLINPRPPVGDYTAYSFPSKNMEYISSGTPLVAFKLDGIPDEYSDYFYEIKENDCDNFSELLETLLNMPADELHSFGLRAQTWVLEKKNPKEQAKKIICLLSELLK